MKLTFFPHHDPIQNIFEQLQTTTQGLTQKEAEKRQNFYGQNSIDIEPTYSSWRRFFAQFNNILIYVLLVSGIVTAFLQHWIDTSVIILAIFINAVIGFIQEQKAESSLKEIRKLLSQQAKVLRANVEKTIDAALLVPGDVVLIKSGDKVPADLRLIESQYLQTQEAILTGESFDVLKSSEPVSKESGLSERTNMLYSGTLVTAGQGKGLVVAIGMNTEIGRISSILKNVKTPLTPLIKKINRFSVWLAAIILILAFSVFLFGTFVRHLPMDEMFMVMIGIAVAAIPEGLPAVISITLALGVKNMAKRNAIVRRLPIIESLGGVTVICADKTGTLTYNELVVSHMITAHENITITGSGYLPEGKFFVEEREIDFNGAAIVKKILYASLLNNDAILRLIDNKWEVSGDPTEGALITLVHKARQNHEDLLTQFPRIDVQPFSPEQRYMATLHQNKSNQKIIYVKGAPERLFELCTDQSEDLENIKKFDREYWEKALITLAQQGERVLAIAYKNTNHERLAKEDIESNLIMLGLLGISDQPRQEASAAIKECMDAGIDVKMITGDHALTAKSIGAKLGIQNSEKVLTGHEIDQLTDDVLANSVKDTNIYARMHPAHKLRLVSALQSKHNVVAMTGDGVNDAPALKKADISIAMGKTGTDVAKEISGLVLADDNFATIVHAVEEGRNIFQNIKRTIQFMLVTDGAEGLILLFAMFAGLTLPITPLQILWVNMVTAVTLSLAFAFALRDQTVMNQSPVPLSASFFSKKQIFQYLIHVTAITFGTIGLFLYETHFGNNLITARTMSVNLLVFFEIFYILALFPWRAKNSINTFWKHWLPVFLPVAGVLLLQVSFTYIPFMQKIFSVDSLASTDWLKIIIISSLIFFLIKADVLFQSLEHTSIEKHSQASSKILQSILELLEKENLSVENFVKFLGTRSIASVVLVFSLPNSLPIIGPPGLSTVTGLPIIFCALQIMFGRKTIWLPKKIATKQIPQKFFQRIIRILLPFIRWCEKWMYPRWNFMFSSYGERAIGIVMFLMSLILIAPIPGANLLPGLSITFLALSILQLDGVFALFGVLFSVGSFYVLSNLIMFIINSTIHWIYRVL